MVRGGPLSRAAQTASETADVASWASCEGSVRLAPSGAPGGSVGAGVCRVPTFLGDSGNNSLSGGTGDDSIAGQGGDDTLSGGQGIDVLSGGEGNARFEESFADSGDQFLGGPGNDLIAPGGRRRGHRHGRRP